MTASYSSSGLISKMFDHQRSVVEEEKENMDGDLEGMEGRWGECEEDTGRIVAVKLK